VIAARWGMLLAAALSILAAVGAAAGPLQGSALRTAATAVVGLLAPLFWPGRAATAASTALRVVVWSAGAAVLAGVAVGVLAHPAQPWLRILSACAMLLPIVLLSHAAVAWLERRWHARSGESGEARELGGRVVALALALLGTLPFWLGPVAELLTARHPGIIDVVVGSSPLTHLAVASGNDLLRNSWFYEHSNLAALRVSYPEAGVLAGCYGAVCLMLALVALAPRVAHRGARTTVIDPAEETT
jgi:hypothetical protein